MIRLRVLLLANFALTAPLGAQVPEKIDLAALARIREEGMDRSKVMEIASYLTDVYGSRLTNSPNIRAAGAWTVEQLKSWGVANARYEMWGPFGRGWSNEKTSVRVVSPTPYPLIAYSGAWSPGTKGMVAGDAMLVRIDSAPDFEKYRGKLRGKWLLMTQSPVVQAHFNALARRWTEAQLDSMAALELPAAGQGGGGRGRGGFAGRAEFLNQRSAFLMAEGAAGELRPGTGRNDGGSIVAQSTGQRAVNGNPGLPTVIVAAEQYARIARTLEKNLPVSLEVDVQNRFHDADLNSFNIIADLDGTDARLRDEVVMLGAHFDSWHSGSGATDNAAGSAVMLEAVRILKESGLPLRRTVRLALWTGEEQGLLGSRAYVTEHFGTVDSTGLKAKPAHARLSAYYNMDNGTGAMRGVYAQGNAAVRPIFQQWMEPLKDLGMRVTTIRSTGSTDHASFDRVGLPGFQFIQDPIEYSTFTHHSNQDQYDRLQAEDLRKNAVIVASFVYLTANRDEKLPRKPVGLTP